VMMLITRRSNVTRDGQLRCFPAPAPTQLHRKNVLSGSGSLKQF
jgi:hypothetical protein